MNPGSTGRSFCSSYSLSWKQYNGAWHGLSVPPPQARRKRRRRPAEALPQIRAKARRRPPPAHLAKPPQQNAKPRRERLALSPARSGPARPRWCPTSPCSGRAAHAQRPSHILEARPCLRTSASGYRFLVAPHSKQRTASLQSCRVSWPDCATLLGRPAFRRTAPDGTVLDRTVPDGALADVTAASGTAPRAARRPDDPYLEVTA
jgi:hypothetical protein